MTAVSTPRCFRAMASAKLRSVPVDGKPMRRADTDELEGLLHD